MKQVIRINERELHRMISESVKRVLNEGGNICWKDEDGTLNTNSKDLYRGVPGAIFVWHGEWSDPEIYYENHEINYYDIEDSLYEDYKSECYYNETTPTENGFEEWANNLTPEDVKEYLDDFIYSMDN